MPEKPTGGGRLIASAQNIKAMLEDGDVLRMIRRRMGLGDTLGALPPECGGTGITTGVDVDGIVAKAMLKAYPVGSIYTSTAATNPGTLFGGKWERIQGRFLFAADGTRKAGSTGGEAEHKLTVDEMPKHAHRLLQGDGRIDYKYEQFSLGRTSYGYNDAFENNIEPTGGDKPHNNMPPYLAVYMWKRTA